MNKGSIVEAVLHRIDRTWSGRLEPLCKLSTLLLLYYKTIIALLCLSLTALPASSVK